MLRRFLTPTRRAPASLAPVPGLLTFHRTIGIGSYELAAWEWGRGPAVLLLHDWNGQASDLLGWVPALAGAGYRVLAADLPAHGRSTGRQASVLDWRRAVLALARYVGPVHAVIGRGLGASAAVLAADQGLNARRLVLLAPGVDPATALRAQALAEGLSPERAEDVLRRVERHLGVSLERLDVRRAERRLDRPVLRLPSAPNEAGIARAVNFLRRGEARPLPEGAETPYRAAV
jgi:pimeloyl-ACP methyl ester carboxylesterase